MLPPAKHLDLPDDPFENLPTRVFEIIFERESLLSQLAFPRLEEEKAATGSRMNTKRIGRDLAKT